MSVNYGNLSFSPLEPYTKIITQYVDTIKNILSTVSDLGFSARGGNVSQSTIFRGTFRFLGGHYIYIFFYSNVPCVMLSANAMFESELNIQSLCRGKIKY